MPNGNLRAFPVSHPKRSPHTPRSFAFIGGHKCNFMTKILHPPCDFYRQKAHSGKRRRIHMKLRILLAGLLCGLAALAESGPELFQKAVTQERAAGNLEEAIKLYQRVAKEFASDRALAAKALVQAARCYEKLGQDKSVNSSVNFLLNAARVGQVGNLRAD